MSDESSVLCAHCKRDIPSLNYQIHIVHCQRNIQLCPKCEEPVPRSELSEHDLEFHSEVKCPECRKTLESSSLDDHKANDCPKRQKQCQFCELELKADTMDEHEEYCGSRTESCEVCDQIVMLKFQQMHVDSGHKKIRPDEDVEDSSSDEDDGAYAAPTRNYARNGHYNRNENRRAGPRLGVTPAYYDQGLDFDYDLHESLQNMELDHARNTATVRPYIPPKPNKRTPNSFMAETDLIPCEFCDAPIAFDELVIHQTGCRPDLFMSRPSAESAESNTARIKNSNGALRPSARRENDITLIPCEFCHKPFDLDLFDFHQRACQNRRAFPASNQQNGYYEDD